MTDGKLLKNLTDHYIQVDILAHLAKVESPVRFTDLKDPGIENSLFMYHANKLLDRGLITKIDGEGFSLTEQGASWINFIGFKHLQPQLSPRLLVQFVITNDNNEVLLSRRTGSMAKILNEYMLPGGLYKYGFSGYENARNQLKSFIADSTPEIQLLTIAEAIQKNDADESYHSIAYIYGVEYNGVPISDDPQYELVWFKNAELVASNPKLARSRFITELFSRGLDTLQSNELFTII